MSSLNKQVAVPYSAEQMYALVNDINAYSTFIPLCSSAEIHEKEDHRLRATIKITTGRIGFGFTTINTLEKDRRISMHLENGPFKSFFIPAECLRPKETRSAATGSGIKQESEKVYFAHACL
ncbi:MAG: type II toxin-antitoxin system RatA family toxin [Gammaproteobacteria bacterium]